MSKDNAGREGVIGQYGAKGGEELTWVSLAAAQPGGRASSAAVPGAAAPSGACSSRQHRRVGTAHDNMDSPGRQTDGQAGRQVRKVGNGILEGERVMLRGAHPLRRRCGGCSHRARCCWRGSGCGRLLCLLLVHLCHLRGRSQQPSAPLPEPGLAAEPWPGQDSWAAERAHLPL